MTFFRLGAAIALVICTTACVSNDSYTRHGMPRADGSGREQTLLIPPMDPNRKISLQRCRESIVYDGGNLLCG